METLLLQAQNGENIAFDAIQTQLTDRIRRFVTRMINNPDDVDDIVQRTFVALYMNLEQIAPPEKLMPFVYRVARNLCYDLLRKHYRRENVDFDDMEYRLATTTISPEENAHWSLLFQQMQHLIDALPDVQRETLILFVEEDLTHAEIADIMHTEVGTVKSRLFYARKTLRQLVSSDMQDALKLVNQKRYN